MFPVRRLFNLLLACGAAGLMACSLIDEDYCVYADTPVALLFSLENPSATETKANYGLMTELVSTLENPQFRGLTDVRILPFYTGPGNPVTAGKQANGYVRRMPAITDAKDTQAFDGHSYHEGLLTASHAHLYSSFDAALPSGTTAVLAYGRAVPLGNAGTLESKQLSGSLLEAGWEDQTAYHSTKDIRFTPDVIYGADAATAADAMAAILTELCGVSYTRSYKYYYNERYEDASISLQWSDENLGDATLKGAFQTFIDGGSPLAASGSSLFYRLSRLRSTLSSYASPNDAPFKHSDTYQAVDSDDVTKELKYKDLYNGLRDALLTKLSAVESSLDAYRQFPHSLGVPDGAALLRWNGADMVPVTDGVGNFMGASRFCFMPPLYYFANTVVSTSYDRRIYEQFGTKNWEQIRALFNVGKIITHDINAVALDLPLQYATGMLVATVQATTSSLPDNDGDASTNLAISAVSTAFPLRGILIGGQYPQNFDFTPITDGDIGNTLLDECFTYDNQVAGVYLTTVPSAEVRTLALPTPLEKNVYFFLEFYNDHTDFQGADGVIPKGSRFYLAGKMEFNPSAAEVSAGMNRVVMQDHYVTLTCQVNSLANAYLTIPQLGTPELQLGIQTQVNWLFSPSSHVVLE